MSAERIRRNPRDRASMRRRAPEASGAPAAAPARVIAEGTPLVAALLTGEAGKPTGRDEQVLAAARDIAAASGHGVLALCLADAPLDGLGALGVDRVAAMPLNAPEDIAATLAAAMDAGGLSHVVAMDGSAAAQGLRRLAAKAQLSLRANVCRIEAGACICAENGGAAERARDLAPLLIAAPDRFRPAPDIEAGAAEPLALRAVKADAAPPILRSEQIDVRSLPLEDAELILSAGAGVTDWDLFHRLAGGLGATEGGSRVVCDAGRLPRDRQVGASGTLVAPRGYVALGISGAVQHLQGIEDCKRVIAVNTDAGAAMIKRADLAVTADTGEVMRALLRLLEARR